jgi:hypothetical protein
MLSNTDIPSPGCGPRGIPIGETEMKKVMLIGDSIRLGYQSRVAALLAGKAAVTGPEDNCRFSAYTLFNLLDWVTGDDWDVIQWNNGQWDTCHMLDGGIHTPLPTYLDYQKRIASILQKKTKRLIFATTTPVWPEHFASGAARPRRNEDIAAYNRAAVDLLRPLGVEITDLHSVIAGDVKGYISSDMVHLTDTGSDLCAACVTATIRG